MEPLRTYSLDEAAKIIMGRAPDGNIEPHKVRWLAERLRGAAKPVLPGYRVGRNWRMTEADIEAAIELLRPSVATQTSTAPSSGMTKTSRRRLEKR